MKTLFFALIGLFCSLLSSAQKIKGVVTDKEGKILPYASVFVKESNKGTNANNEGKYLISLSPGTYTLVCQYVGYSRQEKSITVANTDITLDFILGLQEMTLGEVILKNGEDLAYQIIRNAIDKREYHQNQYNKFTAEVYTKGQMRIRNYPKKILGRKVDFEDGDTSKQKMLYLSETVSNYAVDKPNKEKVEVVSSKVSGQRDGFGLSAPRIYSFYDNNVFIGNNLNPRGFISPISNNALNYYRYKFEGSFTEDGKEINRIKVTPKRKYEPLFSGYINIVDEDWRIHSVQLLLTKTSQMELADSLRIDQLYRPLSKDVWYMSSQVIYPTIKILGFDAYGSFINIYSNYNAEPEFTKKTFTSTILKYTDSANKKSVDYWELTRPVPLMADEISDYSKKDSLEQVRKDPRYLDSLDKKRNKINPLMALFFEQSVSSQKNRTTFSFRPLTELVSFNPAEGWVINPDVTWTKRLDSNLLSRRAISLSPNLRYGFGNKHFNAHLTTTYTFGKQYASSVSLSGGSRVFQFSNNSPVGQRGNSISSLLSEENRMKTYEAVYMRGSYKQAVGGGFTINTGFQFQDRKPLDNITDYTWRDKPDREYTPNYPNEIVNENLKRHQSMVILIGASWQPGNRYIELPDRKISIGSKYPILSAQYIKSVKGLFGSDADFSKWNFNVTDNVNLRLQGRLRYKLGMGGFINTNNVELPDYFHFNGNLSTFATEYVNSFQLLPIYQYSNIDKFYTLAHLEHNFNGFLTNKIPGLKKLNLYLVAGVNGFYINSNKYYYEYFVGFDNIFKQFRIDFVQSFQNGRAWQTGFKLGLSRNSGRRGNDWP